MKIVPTQTLYHADGRTAVVNADANDTGRLALMAQGFHSEPPAAPKADEPARKPKA